MSSRITHLSTAAALPSPTLVERAAGVCQRVLDTVRGLRHRRELTQLLDLDDRMLKDIGLVRNEVLGALAAPLSCDPSGLLRRSRLACGIPQGRPRPRN